MLENLKNIHYLCQKYIQNDLEAQELLLLSFEKIILFKKGHQTIFSKYSEEGFFKRESEKFLSL